MPTVFPVNRLGENAIRFRIGWLIVVTLALGILAAPLAAKAQRATKVYKVGLVTPAWRNAKALGLTIRQSLLIRADDIIQ